MIPRLRPLVAALATACAACGGRPANGGSAHDAKPAAEVSAAAPAVPAAVTPAIVFLGTSLTAGLGLDPAFAYPALIQQKIDSAGLAYTVVNAGVSGETSAGALRRIDWVLQRPVAVLAIETGANDGLRGLDVDSLRANLQAIVDRARRQTPPPIVVLVGMRALPNLGAAYARRFEAVYPAVAAADGLPFVPFLLDGVAGVERLNQSDGMHPTAEGQRIAARNVWKVLAPVLRGR